jgi:hypothetical protein
MLLSKDQILSADDLPYRDVEVPEWKGSVRVRTMTGAERDSFEADIYQKKGDTIELNREHFRAKLLGRCIVDEKGARLFSDKDIMVLSAKSVKALDRLFTVAQELNGISKEEQDNIKKN